MDRRRFLHSSLGATLMGPWLADTIGAEQAPVVPRTPTPAPRKLVLDAHGKNLQWIRDASQVGQAALEMVVGGVCLTVSPYPGHIDPAQVAQQLPAFAKAVRSHGLRVTQLKGPSIPEATDPRAEAIIGAAAQAGLTHYAFGGYTYDFAKPLAPQLDAIKLRLDRFIRLNQKHRMTMVYHTVPGPNAVGGVVLDLLPIFRTFDPRHIGFHWDTGHMALHGDGMWETLMRLAGPYIASVGWRDRGWKQELGFLGEGGPYAGPVPRVEPLVTQPDGSAIPGTPNTAAAGGARLGGAGGRGAAGRAGGGGEDGAPAAAGRGAGRAAGPARGPANSAGAGSIDANNPLYRSFDGEMPKRPIGGLNAKGAGWSAANVAMGTGLVHIPRVATVLAEIGFNGPSELQSEYAGIGGAETGAATLTRPRQWVIGMLKRDVITIRKSFEMANVGLNI